MDGPTPPATDADPRGPVFAYRARVASGALSHDPAQAAAAEALQALWVRLRGYEPRTQQQVAPGLFARLLRRIPGREAPEPIRGLYLVGEVGRGKSMLMDMFFGTAEVPRKQRLHFHEFMERCHKRIHAWKQAHGNTADPIPPLADSIAADAALLCFDEFQVHDVADAMILGRLFQALFARGTVVVATSNTAPDDLFKGRPGRDAFLPFIAVLKDNLEVLTLAAARDYRRERAAVGSVWHVPADGRAERALDAAFRALSGQDRGAPLTLTVFGREVRLPEEANGVVRAGFEDLCGAPLGASDYLALASHARALVLDGIPRFTADNRDKARRFVLLVDALYEHRVRLVASAAAEPDALCPEGDEAAIFARTASRLEEMRSASYQAREHLT
ncbi:MAG: cell division protein ZapE [Acetobacteraceae bacterium]|nr:cell division protein ZapE [Acetobacteraceae bacterium]MDW8397719.1 cell division protein ZapE [Acetobacteraceae bacterium]